MPTSTLLEAVRRTLRGYVVEGKTGLLGSLLGVSLTSMSGSEAVMLYNFIMGFRSEWSMRLLAPLGQDRGAG